MPFAPSFDTERKVYDEFKENKIDVIVCLSWKDECEARVGFDLLDKYGRDGFAVIYFPIDDFHVPKENHRRLLESIHAFLLKGCNIVIHCHAGIGRTGLVLCTLAKLFWKFPNDEDIVVWMRQRIRGAVQVLLKLI